MGADPAAGRQYLTVREVATELRVGEETVRRWIRDGALAATQVGGRRAGLRIERADLEAYLDARRLQMGVRGQPLGVVIHLEHVGPVEWRAPRTAEALLHELALWEGLGGPVPEVAPICFMCGRETALVYPIPNYPYSPSYLCANPRCRATVQDVFIMGGLCDHGEVWVGPVVHGNRAPRSGLLAKAYGIAQCYECDKRTLYHWTRGRQFTLIEWEGYTRRSLTRDATALVINK